MTCWPGFRTAFAANTFSLSRPEADMDLPVPVTSPISPLPASSFGRAGGSVPHAIRSLILAVSRLGHAAPAVLLHRGKRRGPCHSYSALRSADSNSEHPESLDGDAQRPDVAGPGRDLRHHCGPGLGGACFPRLPPASAGGFSQRG